MDKYDDGDYAYDSWKDKELDKRLEAEADVEHLKGHVIHLLKLRESEKIRRKNMKARIDYLECRMGDLKHTIDKYENRMKRDGHLGEKT